MSTLTSFINHYFGLEKKQSNIKTEVIAGLTTFVAMAYVIFVNPAIISQAGIPMEAAVAATIWTACLCSIAMGLFATVPIAVAPGMGINAFFTFYACNTLGLSWQTALGSVFISGIIFMILTITKLRQHIIDAVPLSLKSAIVAGIGFFIAFVGLQQANIVVQSQATAVTLGHLTDVKVLLAIIGIFIIGALMALRFAGAILVGILIITIAGMCLGVAPVPKAVSDVVSFNLPSIKDTFLQMDIIGALDYGLFSVVFTFTIVELFDNLGTLIGVSKAAGLMDEKGKIEGIDRALMTDSAGTMLSAAFGTCTVTSYVESMVGTQVGGRTGLTTVVVGLCFLLAFIFSPLAALIPGYATAPALIVIGAMMLKTIKNIDFSDHTEVIPVFLTIIMMPLTYSIANGFGFGFVSYCILKVLSKRAKEVKPIMWVISLCFVISFILHS